MNDVVDYALQQGDDFGVFLWFMLMSVCWLTSALFILYWAFKFIKLLFKLIKIIFKKPHCFCLLFLLCIPIISYGQTFYKIKERAYPITLSNSLKNRIVLECSKKNKKQIIDYSLKTTSNLLSFSIKNGKLGDNKTSTANCIGYAALCNSICNYAFKINGYKCRSKQVVGYLYIGNINICKIFGGFGSNKFSKFTKDHDVIEIDNVYYDPSLYDYHIILKN